MRVKRMKKKVMLLVDTLTVIFLSIQIQYTIVFVEEFLKVTKLYMRRFFVTLYA